MLVPIILGTTVWRYLFSPVITCRKTCEALCRWRLHTKPTSTHLILASIGALALALTLSGATSDAGVRGHSKILNAMLAGVNRGPAFRALNGSDAFADALCAESDMIGGGSAISWAARKVTTFAGAGSGRHRRGPSDRDIETFGRRILTSTVCALAVAVFCLFQPGHLTPLLTMTDHLLTSSCSRPCPHSPPWACLQGITPNLPVGREVCPIAPYAYQVDVTVAAVLPCERSQVRSCMPDEQPIIADSARATVRRAVAGHRSRAGRGGKNKNVMAEERPK